MAMKRKFFPRRKFSHGRKKSHPPQRFHWVQMFDTKDDSAVGATFACPSKIDVTPSAECRGLMSLDLISPVAVVSTPGLEPVISVRRLEFDIWVVPDLTALDCDASDVDLEFRAGIIRNRGTFEQPLGRVPDPYGLSAGSMSDWACARWMRRWHKSWERKEDCYTSAVDPRAGTSSGSFVFEPFWFPNVTSPVDCTVASGTVASFDTCFGTVPNGTLTMSNTSYDGGGIISRDPGAWHIRYSLSRLQVFREFDSMSFVMAWGDPFNELSVAPPIAIYGSGRALISLD